MYKILETYCIKYEHIKEDDGNYSGHRKYKFSVDNYKECVQQLFINGYWINKKDDRYKKDTLDNSGLFLRDIYILQSLFE